MAIILQGIDEADADLARQFALLRPCDGEKRLALAHHEVGIGDLFHTYLTALGIDSRADYHLNGQTNPVADPAARPIKAVLA